jgi:Flp pilus assembly protein TadG
MLSLLSFRRWSSFARDRRGTSAVEFVLLFPIMVTLFIGSYETTNVLLADLKLTSAAETAADLVAQTRVNTTLLAADFTNITNAATQVMAPFPTGANQLKVAYASVTYNGGNPVIDWHVEQNGAAAISLASVPNNENLANLGTNGTVDSVIVVSVAYAYASPISYVLNAAYNLSEAAFNRPRYVSCVPTYLNANNICP